MKTASSVTSLRELEQMRGRLRRVNVALLGLAVLFVLLLSGDLVRSLLATRTPMKAILPSLLNLEQSMAQIPSLSLPGSLLAQPVASSAQSAKLQGWADELPQIQWKVKGIVFGSTKRAFLSDPDGKQQLWVTEGQQVGPSKVVRIDEKSVTVETGGETREIRM